MTHRPLAWVARAATHPTTVRALKAGVASGLAYLAGTLLPEPLDGYSYYAAMGAFTVVLPAVADSLHAALRTLLAILLGIVIGVGLQLLTATAWWVVGIAITLGVLLAALPVLRNEASWVPLVALFVLAFGGAQPQTYVLGYLTQVPLGAVIGIVVNFVLVPPLSVHDLERGLDRYRRVLRKRLEQLAEAMDEPGTTPLSPELLDDVESRREQLAAALDLNQRARRGNPRTDRFAPLHRALMAETTALQHCDLLAEGAAVALDSLGSDTARELLSPLAETFSHLAEGLSTAPGTFDDEESRAWQDTIQRDIDTLMGLSVDESVPRAQQHLVATLAYAVRDASERLSNARSVAVG